MLLLIYHHHEDHIVLGALLQVGVRIQIINRRLRIGDVLGHRCSVAMVVKVPVPVERGACAVSFGVGGGQEVSLICF